MCDPVSATIAVVSAAASIGMGAKNAHDQRKAQREVNKQQELAEARARAVQEAKGADQQSRTDTAAADAERRRRTAVANTNNVLTARTGALGVPNTASTTLTGTATRTTMG